jgi:adenylylsulfate kinase
MLVVFAGLPGTGKSTLARALAAELHGIVLDKDLIRAALFPPEAIEFSTRQDDFCVAIMLQVARYLFERDPARVVILDGRPYTRQYQVEQIAAFCRETGCGLRLIECICAPEIAEERLRRAAAAKTHIAGNRDPALYQTMRAQAEPIRLPHLVVDTGDPLEACLTRCRSYLAAENPERNEAS